MVKNIPTICIDGKYLKIQQVFGQTTLCEHPDYSGQTELVGLDHGIDSAEFGRRFHEIRKRLISFSYLSGSMKIHECLSRRDPQ